MRSSRKVIAILVFLSGSVLAGLSGCHREDTSDDRTLERRPHTETVAPEDRSNAFRP